MNREELKQIYIKNYKEVWLDEPNFISKIIINVMSEVYNKGVSDAIEVIEDYMHPMYKSELENLKIK